MLEEPSNVKSPGDGVTGSCKLPNVDAGNQTRPREDQQVLLMTKPSLQLQAWLFLTHEIPCRILAVVGISLWTKCTKRSLDS